MLTLKIELQDDFLDEHIKISSFDILKDKSFAEGMMRNVVSDFIEGKSEISVNSDDVKDCDDSLSENLKNYAIGAFMLAFIISRKEKQNGENKEQKGDILK